MIKGGKICRRIQVGKCMVPPFHSGTKLSQIAESPCQARLTLTPQIILQEVQYDYRHFL